MHDEAVQELRKIKDLESNPMFLSWLGYVYGAAGRREEAERVSINSMTFRIELMSRLSG